jgi:YD repeat-containing protein
MTPDPYMSNAGGAGVPSKRGTSGTQTRTFNYNNPANTVTAFLQSAKNPENGTVTYTYSNYLLQSKTDALNHTLTYQYDGYNRLTSVTWSNASGGAQVLRTYIYDTNTLDSTGFSQNIQGRLAAVKYSTYSGTTVQINDMFSYTPAGLPAAKRLQVNEPVTYLDQNSDRQTTTLTANLDSNYIYNLEGEIMSMSYPSTMSFITPTPGPSYNYSYDSMYRLSGMTNSSNNTIVSGVSYNATNQLIGMTFNTEAETRGYNSLNQLITLSASVPGIALENITYAYPAGSNNGKITSMSDTVSGESVVYTYDSLNRLLTAGGNGWGQSYGYDAFGNLLSKTITAGSARVCLRR